MVELFQALGSTYLRSWALETQLRDNFRERFGTEWFASREAGSLLRELWAEGQKPTAEELRQLAQSYEPFRELLRFAVSENYFVLREKLGTAIAKAVAA